MTNDLKRLYLTKLENLIKEIKLEKVNSSFFSEMRKDMLINFCNDLKIILKKDNSFFKKEEINRIKLFYNL